MHVRELVDVAALVALNGPALVESSQGPDSLHLQRYWSTSKCRCENWSRALKAYANSHHHVSREAPDQWLAFRATVDEIFTSEILTRVWTAVLVASDRRRRVKTAEPIARSILASQLESGCRALELLVQGGDMTTAQAVAVNRIRRRAERWCDVLLGGLWRIGKVSEFAVEPERCEDFAAELASRRDRPGGQQSWRLTLVALRNAFASGLSPVAANPETNAGIASSILGCFPAELFDSTGLFRSLWMVRMSANAHDAQGMISELLQSCQPPNLSMPGSRPKRRG